ncbi:MAG TPA: hypothetical protein VEC37_04605 [Bacillota bacterium]|nr:hypothetical protein [Bacillota bacterium]
MSSFNVRSVIYKYLWLICFAIGLSGFVYIYFYKPHTAEIKTVWDYLFKIIMFMFLSSGFAFFPNKSKNSFLWLIPLIVIYAGFVGSRLDYVGFRLLASGDITQYEINEYYIALYLILYPFLISCISFSYRMGGGTSGNCIKLSFVGVLVLFSSFLDVMFEITNPIIIPKVIEYNYYFKVIVGHFPSFPEEVIFCLCHIPLIVGFLMLPIDRWIERIFQVENKPNLSEGMHRLNAQ